MFLGSEVGGNGGEEALDEEVWNIGCVARWEESEDGIVAVERMRWKGRGETVRGSPVGKDMFAIEDRAVEMEERMCIVEARKS